MDDEEIDNILKETEENIEALANQFKDLNTQQTQNLLTALLIAIGVKINQDKRTIIDGVQEGLDIMKHGYYQEMNEKQTHQNNTEKPLIPNTIKNDQHYIQ